MGGRYYRRYDGDSREYVPVKDKILRVRPDIYCECCGHNNLEFVVADLHDDYHVNVCVPCRSRHSPVTPVNVQHIPQYPQAIIDQPPSARYGVLSKVHAMDEYALSADDLSGLKCRLEDNPHYMYGASMRIYLQQDLMKAAITKFGSIDGGVSEKRRRQVDRVNRDQYHSRVTQALTRAYFQRHNIASRDEMTDTQRTLMDVSLKQDVKRAMAVYGKERKARERAEEAERRLEGDHTDDSEEDTDAVGPGSHASRDDCEGPLMTEEELIRSEQEHRELIEAQQDTIEKQRRVIQLQQERLDFQSQVIGGIAVSHTTAPSGGPAAVVQSDLNGGAAERPRRNVTKRAIVLDDDDYDDGYEDGKDDAGGDDGDYGTRGNTRKTKKTTATPKTKAEPKAKRARAAPKSKATSKGKSQEAVHECLYVDLNDGTERCSCGNQMTYETI